MVLIVLVWIEESALSPERSYDCCGLQGHETSYVATWLAGSFIVMANSRPCLTPALQPEHLSRLNLELDINSTCFSNQIHALIVLLDSEAQSHLTELLKGIRPSVLVHHLPPALPSFFLLHILYITSNL